MDARRTEHIVSYRDPATGLVVRGEAIEYADFPAIEWVITLENTGAADTPILADIQPLDTRFPVDPEQRCWVHHARGSQFRLEDFEPFATPLMLKVITELRLATTGGRSSDGALPFINLQMGEAGVMIAVGWTGDWAATLQRSPEGVRVAAGMQRTHLTLHPGEKIRTPRILLLFWEGERLRGHNLLRRFILTHHTPQRDGSPVLMPITDGAWGEFPVDTHLAQVQWIREHNLPAEAYWLDAGWYGDAPLTPTPPFGRAPGPGRWAVGIPTAGSIPTVSSRSAMLCGRRAWASPFGSSRSAWPDGTEIARTPRIPYRQMVLEVHQQLRLPLQPG